MKGATVDPNQKGNAKYSFNSRSREGSDTSKLNLLMPSGVVSTLAPVKGATGKS